MNLVKNVALKFHREFNRGRISLPNEFCEGRAKSVVLPETIDALRKPMLQDRNVTYREIATTIGISWTSIHLMLHKHCIACNDYYSR